MSTTTPPSPNGRQHWPIDPGSSNGATARTRSDSIHRLVVLGYITAIAMPLLGLIVGIVIATRRDSDSKHGTWIILISIVASVVWVLLLASGVFTEPSNDLNY
jgi:uncharacterized membrane protein